MVEDLRTISSLRLRERPMKKKSSAPRMSMETAPTEIPAMAPLLRPCFGPAAGGSTSEGVEGVVRGVPSAGNASPGCSI